MRTLFTLAALVAHSLSMGVELVARAKNSSLQLTLSSHCRILAKDELALTNRHISVDGRVLKMAAR
jgi:hypothetical protein